MTTDRQQPEDTFLARYAVSSHCIPAEKNAVSAYLVATLKASRLQCRLIIAKRIAERIRRFVPTVKLDESTPGAILSGEYLFGLECFNRRSATCCAAAILYTRIATIARRPHPNSTQTAPKQRLYIVYRLHGIVRRSLETTREWRISGRETHVLTTGSTRLE